MLAAEENRGQTRANCKKKNSKSLNQTNIADTYGTVAYGSVVYDKDSMNYDEVIVKPY